MEIGDFRRAITNGLGRAVLWLRENPWKLHDEAICHVCLHNTAYDAQCEGSRAEYVYEIVCLTNEAAHFADIAERGLLEAKDYWDADHLFRLNRLFAQAGNVNSRNAIYNKFEQDDAAEHFIGAEELVKLDGLEGLLFVLDRVGAWVKTHPEHWIDDCFDSEGPNLGPDGWSSVRTAAATNPNIRRYLETVEKHKQATNQRSRPDYRNFTYIELRDRILAAHGDIPKGWLFGWGRHASKDSIRSAAADLLDEKDDRVLIAYLRIFNRQPFPLNHESLIRFATSQNKDLATASRRALRHIRNDSVRGLALDLIQSNQADSDAVELLVKNYGPNDHILIESLLGAPISEDDFHWTAHAAVHVFEANPQAIALPSLLKIYEGGRCSLCRNAAVKIMVKREIIPSNILEECKHDSNEDTRQFATSVADPCK